MTYIWGNGFDKDDESKELFVCFVPISSGWNAIFANLDNTYSLAPIACLAYFRTIYGNHQLRPIINSSEPGGEWMCLEDDKDFIGIIGPEEIDENEIMRRVKNYIEESSSTSSVQSPLES